VPTKFLCSPILVATESFSITIRGAINMGQGVVTKRFWLPSYRHYFLDGDRIVLVTTKGGLSYFLESSCRELLKGSQKNVTCPFF
jgi:hypothetical protein